jgi:hypothetical protein
MEKEMCHYLECNLNADPVTPREFEEMVKKDFVRSSPHTTYIVPSTYILACTHHSRVYSNYIGDVPLSGVAVECYKSAYQTGWYADYSF